MTLLKKESLKIPSEYNLKSKTMFRTPRIIYNIIAVIFINAFLILLTVLNFWLFANGEAKLIYIITITFSVVIFFSVSFFLIKISDLKKGKIGLARLLEKNEKKLQISEMERNRISEIFLNISEGILVVDENEKVSMVNPKARKVLGIKEKDVKDLPVINLARLPDIKPLVPYFLSSRPVFRNEVKLRNFVIELSVTPLFFERKNIGKLIILRDITGESLMEKMKTDFLLSAVHQLKTSVASVKWSVKMFLSGDFGKISKEQKDVAERLYKRNDALISLIDRLLDTAKIEDSVYSYKKTLIDLQDLVQSAVIYFQDKIRSKGIKVKFDKPVKGLPKIMADKEKIGSVIQNLFDNALKYTNTGGSILVGLESEKDGIKFKIKDSGIGIPKNQQPKIFNKFFRAANANKIETNGSGLGLFIAKKVIEDHGGSIWFESEENKGSAFFFILPWDTRQY